MKNASWFTLILLLIFAGYAVAASISAFQVEVDQNTQMHLNSGTAYSVIKSTDLTPRTFIVNNISSCTFTITSTTVTSTPNLRILKQSGPGLTYTVNGVKMNAPYFAPDSVENHYLTKSIRFRP